MKIFIKNMLSLQDVSSVRAILDRLKINYTALELGGAEVDKLSKEQIQILHAALIEAGMEILDNTKLILIERIKILIILMIRFSDDPPAENYSHYISKKLDHNYTYLANLFSASEKITIEHYIISHKIEKVKELLMADTYNLTEISQKMHYSSVAHLSNQFKKVTGLTTTSFKNNADESL